MGKAIGGAGGGDAGELYLKVLSVRSYISYHNAVSQSINFSDPNFHPHTYYCPRARRATLASQGALEAIDHDNSKHRHPSAEVRNCFSEELAEELAGTVAINIINRPKRLPNLFVLPASIFLWGRGESFSIPTSLSFLKGPLYAPGRRMLPPPLFQSILFPGAQKLHTLW